MRSAKPASVIFVPFCYHMAKKTQAGRKMRSAKLTKSKPLSVDIVDLNEFDAASCLQTRTANLQAKKRCHAEKMGCTQPARLCVLHEAFFCIVVDIFQAM